ncbi:MAG TPA: LysM peptidoglycan-binding domain-containing protein [Thermoanaerobaculia bacterium]|nr:LysM peptidoglycan-binding domain-containing protein [Thermoanaerobaculia bacterium]
MGLFGKSFEEKVQVAIERVRGQFPNAQINARVDQGDTVTLTGHAADLDTKTQIMAAFNAAVETKNTVNQITIDKPTPQAAGTAFSSTPGAFATPLGTTSASEQRTHDIVSGDTLSALAKRYYGDASKYNRIFEANRDQLSDPDKIKVGQKLKIPV